MRFSFVYSEFVFGKDNKTTVQDATAQTRSSDAADSSRGRSKASISGSKAVSHKEQSMMTDTHRLTQVPFRMNLMPPSLRNGKKLLVKKLVGKLLPVRRSLVLLQE